MAGDVKDRAEAMKEIKKLINYLGNHKHRLAYQDCKDTSLPIGSGGIESANKHICHVRLKRSGAWWLEESSDCAAPSTTTPSIRC